METETTQSCPHCQAPITHASSGPDEQGVCASCKQTFEPAALASDTTDQRYYNRSLAVFLSVLFPGAGLFYLNERSDSFFLLGCVLLGLLIAWFIDPIMLPMPAFFWFLSIVITIRKAKEKTLTYQFSIQLFFSNLRKWIPRFSIRTLLIITFIICLPLSWVGYEREKYRRKWQLAEKLGMASSVRQFDYDADFNPTRLSRLRNWLGIAPPNSPRIASFTYRSTDTNEFYLLKEFPDLEFTGSDVRQVITDDDLRSIESLSKLKFLAINNSTISDRGICTLTKFRNLGGLTLSSDQITDQALETLSQLTNLKQLHLSGNQLTGKGILHLTTLTKLEELTLKNCQVSEEAAEALAQIDQLKRLKLINVSISDLAIINLCNSHSLEWLWVESPTATDAGLQSLGQLETLEFLRLVCPLVTDEGIKKIKNLLNLNRLTIHCPKVTDAGISSLDNLPKLSFLRLIEVKLKDKGLQCLNHIESLEYLAFVRTGLIDSDISELTSIAILLEDVELQEPQLTDKCLDHLVDLPHLDSLSLCGTKVTDAGLKTLQLVPKLEKLDLSDTNITDAGLHHLRNCRSLRALDLKNTKVTGSGLVELQGIPNLYFLQLGGNHLNEQELTKFLVLPVLHELSINGPQFSDRYIQQVTALPKLDNINVRGTRVTIPALRKFQNSRSGRNGLSYPDDMPIPSMWYDTRP